MSSILRLLALALWSTVLLLSERRLVGQYVAVNAEANLVPEFECTAADGGRCDDANSCPTPSQTDEKCALRRHINLQEHSGGCNCRPPPDFCDGEQARNTSADFSMDITYSIPHYQQFNVTASVMNLVGSGNWSYKVMMTGEYYGATKITGNRCACGYMDHRKLSISRTDDFNTDEVDGQHRSLHLCLRNGSSTVYLVKNFSVGLHCSDFASHHDSLSSFLCNQPTGDLGILRVNELSIKNITTSTPPALQVSWKKPHFLPKNLHGIKYYLTLNSTLGTHTFNVSNSTNVTFTVRAGLNYTMTVRTWIWCETTSCQEQVNETVFVSHLSTPTPPTMSPTSPTSSTTDGPSSKERIILTGMAVFIICFAVTAVLFLFITVLVVIICCHWTARKNRQSRSERCYVESPGISNSCSTETASSAHVDTISGTSSHSGSDQTSYVIPNTLTGHQHKASNQVLIVGSQRNPTEEHVQLVAEPLWGYKGIEILMHNVNTVEADRRLTPSEWVQQTMEQAEFVVCICNKEFMEDWSFDGQRMCHERSLVKSVSHHISGLVNHGQNNKVMQKFITVVQCEQDLRYIPTNLRNCNSFILNCDADVGRLVRHLQEIPAVTINFMESPDHISSRL